MLFRKSCFYCRQPLRKGEGLRKSVAVYGKVGRFKKLFCTPGHSRDFELFTEELNRRKRVCLPCALR